MAGEQEDQNPGPDDVEDDGADGAQAAESEDEEEDADADEGDGDGEGEGNTDEGEGDPEPIAARRRDAPTFEEIDRRAKDLEERERRLNLDAQQREAERVKAEAQEEQKLLGQMTPEQQASYLIAKNLKNLESRLNKSEFDNFDRADKIAFEAKYATDARFKKLMPDVERGYQELRKAGTKIERVAVLDYLLGKSIREGGPRALSQQRRAANKRIENARGRPSSGRADATGSGRSRGTVVSRAETEDWAI